MKLNSVGQITKTQDKMLMITWKMQFQSTVRCYSTPTRKAGLERKYMTKELKMSENFPKDSSIEDCNMFKVFR